jgi:hypothetical protein
MQRFEHLWLPVGGVRLQHVQGVTACVTTVLKSYAGRPVWSYRQFARQ